MSFRPITPSALPVLLAKVKPLSLFAFQHGLSPQVPPPATSALKSRLGVAWERSKRQNARPSLASGLPNSLVVVAPPVTQFHST